MSLYMGRDSLNALLLILVCPGAVFAGFLIALMTFACVNLGLEQSRWLKMIEALRQRCFTGIPLPRVSATVVAGNIRVICGFKKKTEVIQASLNRPNHPEYQLVYQAFPASLTSLSSCSLL